MDLQRSKTGAPTLCRLEAGDTAGWKPALRTDHSQGMYTEYSGAFALNCRTAEMFPTVKYMLRMPFCLTEGCRLIKFRGTAMSEPLVAADKGIEQKCSLGRFEGEIRMTIVGEAHFF
jgi:hypothetical protein